MAAPQPQLQLHSRLPTQSQPQHQSQGALGTRLLSLPLSLPSLAECPFTAVSFTLGALYLLVVAGSLRYLYRLRRSAARRAQRFFLLLLLTQAVARAVYFILWPTGTISRGCSPSDASYVSYAAAALGTLPGPVLLLAFSFFVYSVNVTLKRFLLHGLLEARLRVAAAEAAAAASASAASGLASQSYVHALGGAFQQQPHASAFAAAAAANQVRFLIVGYMTRSVWTMVFQHAFMEMPSL